MPFQLYAHYQSVDAANAYTYLAAVADQTQYTNSNDLRVPKLNKLFAVAAAVGSGGLGVARLSSPSLRREVLPQIEPVMGRTDGHQLPTSPAYVHDFRKSPLVLDEGEAYNVEVHSDTTAAARQWILSWFCDNVPAEVDGGAFVIRATGATTLGVGAWTTVAITFDQSLPVGNYDVVGFRARSSNLYAARIIFPEQGPRPGVIGCNASSDISWGPQRRGGLGVFGTFNSNNPPQVECLAGVADTAEVFEFDLVKK